MKETRPGLKLNQFPLLTTPNPAPVTSCWQPTDLGCLPTNEGKSPPRSKFSPRPRKNARLNEKWPRLFWVARKSITRNFTKTTHCFREIRTQCHTSVKFLKKTLAFYGQQHHLAGMNSVSHTTARVVQPELQPSLQQLDEVSSHCAGINARIKSWFAGFFSPNIPYGYEDESGFHYGKPELESSANQ